MDISAPKRLMLAIAILWGLPGAPLQAQAVQAVVGSPQRSVRLHEGQRVEVARLVGYYQGLLASVPRCRATLEAARLAGEKVLRARGMKKGLAEATLDFQDAAEEASECLRQLEALPSIQNVPPVPGVVELSSDIAFMLGAGITWGKEFKRAYDFSVSSNLLGAAVGAGFGLLGSGTLEEYFTRSVSAGVTVPLGSDERVTGQLGLGLGRWSFGSSVVWPTLVVNRYEGEDLRVPRELSAPEQNPDWSTFSLTFAVVPHRRWLEERWERHHPFPIVVIGVEAPFFHQGGLIDTLGALFDDSDGGFRRAGDWRIQLGIAVPAFRIPTADGSP